MFNIGDRIVYPRQGVGVINLIEEKEFNGKLQKYYNIQILHNSLKLMLPASSAETCHLRHISDEKELDDMLYEINNYHCAPIEAPRTRAISKERLQNNTDNIKKATLKNCAEVICELTEANKTHPLNTSEKELLNNTKKIIVDEISLVKHISVHEASDLLNNSLN